MAEYQKAAEFNPNSAAFHKSLAETLDKLGRHDKAEAERQKAAELES